MAYNQNIPQPTDTLSQSQGDILANFRALNALYTNNIQPAVQFPIVPDQTTPAGQIALYSKLNTVTGAQDLFIRAPSNGAIVDMTGSSQAATGWSYLPSGLLIKWGRVGTATGNSQPITLPTGAIPVFNNIFQVLLTPMDTSGSRNFSLWLNSITGVTGFVVNYTNPTSATFVNYLVIGN